MWWGKKNKHHRKIETIDNLIAETSQIHGDLLFTGVLHIDGTIKGNVHAKEGEGEHVVALSETGTVEGEIRAPNVIINGVVHGDVHCVGYVELAPKAQIMGDVYYQLLEIKSGAEITGKLIHLHDKNLPQQAVKKEPNNTEEKKEPTP